LFLDNYTLKYGFHLDLLTKIYVIYVGKKGRLKDKKLLMMTRNLKQILEDILKTNYFMFKALL